MDQLKIVVVGDGTVGKTSLLYSLMHDDFTNDYEPTLFEQLETNIRVDNKDHFVFLFDMAGQETHSGVRPMSYQQTDVFIVCFNVASDKSFQHIQHLWLPEIKQYQANTPFFVVGTKKDLRDDLESELIELNAKSDEEDFLTDGLRSIEFYRKKALSWGAVTYMECSSKSRENVQEVFETAVRIAVEDLENKKKALLEKKASSTCCNIL